MCSSFQASEAGGEANGLGTNLFHSLACVPPLLPTLPVSTLRKKSVLATCQPPRLPMLALRQVWVASLPSQLATSRAVSRMRSMGTWLSSAAPSKVNSAYNVFSSRSKSSKSAAPPRSPPLRFADNHSPSSSDNRPFSAAASVSSQLTQRRTKSRS